MLTIGRLNGAIYRNIQMILTSKLKNLEINNGQYDFLYVISLNEGISQKQLSEYLYIGKSTTAKAIKCLVSRGYVRKERDTSDNRIEHLYLTELGREVTPVVAKVFKEFLEVAAKGLSDTEHEQLLFLMEKVLNNLVSENELLDKEVDTIE